MTTPPTALILGASRGLGLALAEEYLKRGWRVIATARRGKRTALHDLADRAGGRLTVETLDITNADAVAALRARLEGAGLDLLFVNAGVANDPAQTIGEVSIDTFVEVMVTNALAPMRAIEAFQDLVPDSGVIGVMSSELASIANNRIGTWEVYRASKAALNTLMKSFAARHRADPRALAPWPQAGSAPTWAAPARCIQSRRTSRRWSMCWSRLRGSRGCGSWISTGWMWLGEVWRREMTAATATPAPPRPLTGEVARRSFSRRDGGGAGPLLGRHCTGPRLRFGGTCDIARKGR